MTRAESVQTIVVEGNHYFPADAINAAYCQLRATYTICIWKGIASYYTMAVDGQTNRDAVWYYPAPKEATANIKGYVAFWRGVNMSES